MRELHGMTGTPEHRAWKDMKKRCYGRYAHNYKNYGGRGIRVCDEWLKSFTVFYEDIGPRPSSKHSLDRTDNDGNYEPGNVRWATRLEQATHRTTSRLITIGGNTKHLGEWCRTFNVHPATVHTRVSMGLTYPQALQHKRNTRIKKG
jgi:hypothetical protein